MAAEIAAGVPSERIVVAGFSQGGAVALNMLRSDVKVAGIVGESSSMLLLPKPHRRLATVWCAAVFHDLWFHCWPLPVGDL